ncbi:hypothetical protein [Clostridium sp.]
MSKNKDDRDDLLIDDSLPLREVDMTPEEEARIEKEFQEAGLL